MTVVDCFSGMQVLGIKEIAGVLSVSRSMAHRYATTLLALGWLEQTRDRKYRLSHRSAWPGMAFLGDIALVSGCESVLRELRARTGHTASLGVLDGTRVIYVRRFSAHRKGQYDADGGLRAGARVPVYCTALGHVLLAGLPEEDLAGVLTSLELVRHTPLTIVSEHRLRERVKRATRDGFAVSDREFIGKERSVAVPVSVGLAGWRLAVELNVPAASLPVDALVGLAGREVREAAARIASRLKASASGSV